MTGAGPEGWLESFMKPETMHKRLALVLAPLAFGVLSACGDGGGGVGVAEGGIRGTGSSVGPVSGFGSVFVNGVKFNTDGILNREVESNDGLSTEADLDKGMILRVEGVWRQDQTGEASRLEYDDTFRGKVSSVTITERSSSDSPRAGTITVLGQVISFDRATVIRLEAGFDSEASLADKLVRVSAWRSGSGYRASYVGEISNLPGSSVEVEGPVAGHNSQQRSFRIGSQHVVYLNDSVFRDGVTAGDLDNNERYIEVEGGLGIDDVITAETIRPADSRRFLGNEDEDIEVTGPVENYSPSGSEFLLNGVTIVITDDTDFDDISRSQLQNGMLVKVEGEFRNGVVIAEEIEPAEGDAEVEARVLGVGTRPDSWDIGGVTVVLTNSTRIDYEDGLTAISTGVFAEVDGVERRTSDGVFLEALNIEVEASGDSEFEMTGRYSPSQLQGNVLEVLGVTMMVEPGAIEDNLDNCEFVEVEYEQDGSGFKATEVECEDD